jgi:lipoate-protein ligase A
VGTVEIGDYDAEDAQWRATRDDGRERRCIYTVARPVVVLGRGSDAAVELRLDACLGDAVPILRRRGGGCAVVLDPGCVVVAISVAAAGLGENLEHFARLNALVIDALVAAGAPGVGRAGTSDLVVGDRKVGGTCIYRTRGVVHYAASLLAAPDVALMERYLAHPPREPAYRRGRRHADFVARLADLPGAPPAADLARRLELALHLPDPPPAS